MYYIIDTAKPLSQASADVASALARNGFGVSHLHDLALPRRVSANAEKGKTECGLIKPVQVLSDL